MQESKKPWLSKTMWFGLLTGLSPFLAAVVNVDLNQILANHGAVIASVWGALAVVLRYVTKDKVQLGE